MKEQLVGILFSKVIWHALRSRLTFEQASRVKTITEARVSRAIEQGIEEALNP